MKKQGFTLIELMVVIVIMGILAAVAVPKLFGMIAKSKASEVGPAAGTYVKLQQAYVSETGLNYGNFGIIGYTAPGLVTTEGSNTASAVSQTTNFQYSDTKSGYSNGTAALPTGDQITWTAKARVALNDCAVNSEWRVSLKKATSAADAVQFTSSLSDATHCQALTPSFDKIGK